MSGPTATDYADDTWEYDGTNWKQVSAPRTAPPSRSDHALVYDSARGQAVMFGGRSGASKFQDTWEWNGYSWAQRAPASLPPARYNHAMAFDSSRGRSVLLGGFDDSSVRSDTWEWDGSNWVQATPVSSPPARSDLALTFDAARARVLLFGGFPLAADTWEWDGTNWVQKFPSTAPPSRYSHALAFDAARSRTVVFGGFQDPSRLFDTWEWDGTTWADRSPASSPPARYDHSLARTRGGTRVLLYGGNGSSGSLGDTWEWDGTAWMQDSPATSPAVRAGHALTYDSTRDSVLLFGGGPAASPLSDTWELPSNKPPSVSAVFSASVVHTGQPISLTASFTDPEGDTPSFRWLQTYGPHVTLSGATSAQASFTPTAAGEYGFEVTAADGRDGYAYALGSVRAANAPPTGVSIAGPAARVAPGAAVTLTGSAVDADGEALTYTWSVETQPVGGDGTFTNFGSSTATFQATKTGAYTVRLRVSDGFGGSGTSFVTVTVAPAGAAFSTAASVPRTWGWVQRATQVPPGRPDTLLVFDSRRAKAVLFGGFANPNLNDTWEWDGLTWSEASPLTRPPGRGRHAVAYDSVRGRVVVFGGNTSQNQNFSVMLNDTWEWDGVNWSRANPVQSPPVHTEAAMAFDAARGQTVLFGGSAMSATTQDLNDTWEWNGTQWLQRHPATSPRPRKWHAMVYESARSRVLVFGGAFGFAGPSSDLNDTWEWDGTNWADRTPATSPGIRETPGLAYDAARDRVVLFGGFSRAPGGGILGDTWEWDGTNWSQKFTATSPPARDSHGMAFDNVRNRVLLFGGENGANNDTWEYDGTNWKLVSEPVTSPSARIGHGLSFDSTRGKTLLFGGKDLSSNLLSDTWSWDGVQWTSLLPGTGPSARKARGLTHDSARGMSVLFGGQTAGSVLGDTWEWDGSSWTNLSPVSAPSIRMSPLAFDLGRGRTVLFSGVVPSDGLNDETWEYDGISWLQRAPFSRPPARNGTLALDSARGVAVLFG
ncbi:MAG: PKD domain-containing protein [Candidatus Wallbacteria bacterium]|nr:PKD domain-containing protein [Candidatus Wallbacteria bacterium]